jgi:hypothetical protein
MALEIQHEFDRRDKVGSCIDTMKRLEHHMENVIRQQFGVSVTITKRGGSGEVTRWTVSGLPTAVCVAAGRLKGTGMMVDDDHAKVAYAEMDGEAYHYLQSVD